MMSEQIIACSCMTLLLAGLALAQVGPVQVCDCSCIQICCTTAQVTALNCATTQQSQPQQVYGDSQQLIQENLIKQRLAATQQLVERQRAQQYAQQLANQQIANQQLANQQLANQQIANQKLAEQQLNQFAQQQFAIQPLFMPPQFVQIPASAYGWTHVQGGVIPGLQTGVQTGIQTGVQAGVQPDLTTGFQHQETVLPFLLQVDTSKKYLLSLIISICEDQVDDKATTTSSPKTDDSDGSDPPDSGVQAQRMTDCDNGPKRPYKICKLIKEQLKEFVVATLDTKNQNVLRISQLIGRSKFLQAMMPW